MAIKFDLSDVNIPADADITEAILSVYSYDDVGYGDNGKKSIYSITADWSENTITWSNKPNYNSTAISSHTSSTTATWNDFEVTSVIEDIVQNNANNYGFYIIFPSRDYGVKMRSSEYSDVAYRPKLNITCEFQNPTIVVQNGGEEWEQYTTQNIEWIDNITGNVKIELLDNGTVFKTIATSVPSNGTYEWNIPEDFQIGEYIVQVTSIDDPSVTDMSDEPITIIAELIIALPYTQEFDGWSVVRDMDYWEQSTDDDIDWTIQEGPTPSRIGSSPDLTGAEADHSGSGKYIYIEASDPNNPSKTASIVSPKFNFTNLQDPQLTVWSHMFSGNSSMGDFYVDIKVDNNAWQEGIMTISGDQGDAWKSKTMDLDSYTNSNKRVRFRLRGTTGSDWCSDICIDDFIIDGPTPTIPTLKRIPSSYDLKFFSSAIHFQVPKNVEKNRISVSLYNVSGKLVKTLVNDNFNTGYYSVPLNKLANGLYVCRMEAGKFNKAINIILTK